MGAVLMISIPSSRLGGVPPMGADGLHPQPQIGGGSHLWVLCWGSHPWVLPDLPPQQQNGGVGSHLWVLCWGFHPWVLPDLHPQQQIGGGVPPMGAVLMISIPSSRLGGVPPSRN